MKQIMLIFSNSTIGLYSYINLVISLKWNDTSKSLFVFTRLCNHYKNWFFKKLLMPKPPSTNSICEEILGSSSLLISIFWSNKQETSEFILSIYVYQFIEACQLTYMLELATTILVLVVFSRLHSNQEVVIEFTTSLVHVCWYKWENYFQNIIYFNF